MKEISFKTMAARWVSMDDFNEEDCVGGSANVVQCQTSGEVFSAPVSGVLRDVPEPQLREICKKSQAVLNMPNETVLGILTQLGAAHGTEWLMNAASYELRPCCGCESKVPAEVRRKIA